MNYAELTATIEDYCETTFTPDELATFTKQAEQRIYNTVQFPAIRRNKTGTTTVDNKYLTCPSDWLATFSLAVIDASGNYNYLLDKDVNFIRASYPSPTSTGLPEYYALFDQNTFILGPTPDSNYSVELHYYYYPESIVTANNTWLGDNFDSALLYGALLEAATYMKESGDQDVYKLYQTRYDDAMALLKQLGDGKNRRDAYRNGQVRYQVT
jgi:hypothetical protein